MTQTRMWETAGSRLLKPQVLVLGSKFDLTCDYVVSALRRTNVSYLRINSEDLSDIIISMDPLNTVIHGSISETKFILSPDNLKSVLYRRPVFLRDYGGTDHTPFERFQRHQWAAFTRNFMILENCFWMNHPVATYKAEHKALQLMIAKKIGFDVPRTMIGNTAEAARSSANSNGSVAVKGVDTVMMRNGSTEVFGFTTLMPASVVAEEDVQAAPVTFQEALEHKLDLRVTVVGRKVFAVAVTQSGQPIQGDWRRVKESATFEPYELPSEISNYCCELVHHLGLTFGAIDLARQEDVFYFLEINPTGEWAWLVDETGFAIDESVAYCLGMAGQCV